MNKGQSAYCKMDNADTGLRQALNQFALSLRMNRFRSIYFHLHRIFDRLTDSSNTA